MVSLSSLLTSHLTTLNPQQKRWEGQIIHNLNWIFIDPHGEKFELPLTCFCFFVPPQGDVAKNSGQLVKEPTPLQDFLRDLCSLPIALGNLWHKSLTWIFRPFLRSRFLNQTYFSLPFFGVTVPVPSKNCLRNRWVIRCNGRLSPGPERKWVGEIWIRY